MNAPTRLAPGDAEAYLSFRRRMLSNAPWAFSATVDDDVALDLQFLRSALAEPENAILAVRDDDDPASLLASAGIVRMKSPKFSHRAKLWGVFVDPRHRRRGLGRAVTAAAVDLARSWRGVAFVDVGVSANSPDAHAIYRTLGFVEWGREPETIAYQGKRYDEIYMALRT